LALLQDAAQLPPAQTRAPFAGCDGHVTHALPQNIVPAGQVPQAPWLHVPFVHAVLVDSTTQPCGSRAHVASVVGPAQVFPTALQTGSALHVHAAVPAAPVQLWCVPQATGWP
jgi:hypothetical protein